MNRFIFLAAKVLVCASALAMVTSAIGGDQVPFKGNLSLLSLPAPSNDGCPAGTERLNVTGGGYMTQMGAVTDQQFVCLNPSDFTFTGEFTLTAPSGDTVSASLGGYAQSISGPVFMVHGQWTITGGTGRFGGATGAGIATGPVNLATGEGTHRLDGTISSVGSNVR